MNKFNFKKGDLVYCPMVTDEIMKVDSSNRVNFISAGGHNHSHSILSDGKFAEYHNNRAYFPATQEWYEKLSHVYSNLEKPLIKKPSEVIIQALLDDGNAGVLCWVSDFDKEPSSNTRNFINIVTRIFKGEYETFKGYNWKYATPIMPIKTFNQTIIDYVSGEVIVEFKNG